MPTTKQIENKLINTSVKIKLIQEKIKIIKKENKSLEKEIKQIQQSENLNQELINTTNSDNTNTIDITYFTKQGLNHNQAVFVCAYLTNDYNKKQAYLTAHPNVTEGTAGTLGHMMLKNLKVKEAINKYITEHLDIDKMTMEKELVKMYKTLAFYDPGKLLNTNGTLRYKNMDDIPEDLRKCIEGIKTYQSNQYVRKEVKLAERYPALDKLASYIEMIKEKETSLELRMTEDTAKKMANIFKRSK